MTAQTGSPTGSRLVGRTYAPKKENLIFVIKNYSLIAFYVISDFVLAVVIK